MNIYDTTDGRGATLQATGFDHDGNIVSIEKVVHKTGKYEDYVAEINESYHLGWTPFREVKRDWGKACNPVRCYKTKVYVSDDTGAYSIGDVNLKSGGFLIVYKQIPDT